MMVSGDSLVSNTINSLESKPVRSSPASAVQRRLENAPDSADTPTADADVQLTGASRNLTNIAQSLLEQPAVDEARVAAVKAKIEDGSYSVDPQRVADKLLRLQSDLSPLEGAALK